MLGHLHISYLLFCHLQPLLDLHGVPLHRGGTQPAHRTAQGRHAQMQGARGWAHGPPPCIPTPEDLLFCMAQPCPEVIGSSSGIPGLMCGD